MNTPYPIYCDGKFSSFQVTTIQYERPYTVRDCSVACIIKCVCLICGPCLHVLQGTCTTLPRSSFKADRMSHSAETIQHHVHIAKGQALLVTPRVRLQKAKLSMYLYYLTSMNFERVLHTGLLLAQLGTFHKRIMRMIGDW